jgi:hypothetical protein
VGIRVSDGYRFQFSVTVVLPAEEDVPVAEIDYRGPFAYAREENGELVAVVHDVHGGGERRMPLRGLIEILQHVEGRLTSLSLPSDLPRDAELSRVAPHPPSATPDAEGPPPPRATAGDGGQATGFADHLTSWVARNEDHLQALGDVRFDRSRRASCGSASTTCILSVQVGADEVELLVYESGEVEFGFGRVGATTEEHHDVVSSAQLDVLLWRLAAQAGTFRTLLDEPRVAVFADDGVSFYSSVDAFAGYAEPPDALDGVYTAVYDATGRRHRVVAPAVWRAPRPDKRSARRAWNRELRRQYYVEVESDDRFPVDQAAAARAIRDGLRGRHPSEELERMGLRELLRLETPVT